MKRMGLPVKRLLLWLACCLGILIIVTGCSTNNDVSHSNGNDNGNSSNGASNANEMNNGEVEVFDPNPEDITLKIHFGEDELFIDEFIKPAEEEFPHITFEHVEGSYEELVTAQVFPDILWFWNKGGAAEANEYELTYDMTDLVQQYNFDISRFDSNHLAEWQVESEGEMWALPVMTSRFALRYNRDIFDTFGVAYPDDGMTWDEVIQLARNVTGERDGVEYQGLYMPKHEAPIFWTAQNLLDPDTHEPLWTDDEVVREYFDLYNQAYSIPGNPYIPEHWEEDGWEQMFQEEQRLAMVGQFFGLPPEDSNVNWDIATYPEPEKGVPSRGWAMGISATSEHKDEVMRVFDFWYSDEHLLNESFTRGPLHVPYQHLYDDGSVQEKTMELQGDIWEGRNMEALYSLPVADPPERISEYESPGMIEAALYDYVNEADVDLNTFLREKYEEELVRIEEEQLME